jgi:hypothetical protein
MSEEARFFVSFYAGGKVIHEDEYAPTVPAIGQGVHFGGKAYRVQDVWLNYEKHAPVNWGIAVFLGRAELGAGFLEVSADYYGTSEAAASEVE